MKRFNMLCLSLLAVVSLVACGKQAEPEVEDDTSNYAVNDVSTNDDSEETEEEVEDYSVDDVKYNIVPDSYADEVQDISSVSIDNKLVEFPSSYSTISELFGELYTTDFGQYSVATPIDTSATATSFEVSANPSSGAGSIIFYFNSTSGEPTTITEMTCTGFTIQSGNHENDKCMTCALPGYINFGSTVDEIKNEFGNDTTNKSFVSDENWMLFYSLDNVDLQFVGYDKGLYIVTAKYH